MKFIMQENVPRWYHLFWNYEKGGLFLQIHRFFLEHCEHKNFEPYFKGLENRSDYLPLFESYEPRLGQARFGINDAIVLVEEDSEWLTYQVKLPLIIQNTGRACEECGGTGRRYPESKEDREKCGDCDGGRMESYYVYSEIHKVCFSLQILLSALAFPIDREVPTEKKQLFTVTTCCLQQSQGHSAGGYASPELVRFLEEFSTSYEVQIELPTVREAIAKAYCALHGKSRSYDNRFYCCTRAGQVIMSCPGDACEIHTESRHSIGDGTGESITCHNLDSAVQQISLLAGLAALSSLYDQANA
jgi:hypothetical protein